MLEIEVDARERLIPSFVRRFEMAARDAIANHGRFACALPGGSVATTFFPALVNADVDWPHVHFFWCDERAVPDTDPQSNYAAAWQPWLSHIPAQATHLHRMRADRPDLDRAADEYGEELAQTLGAPPRLDLVLMGMGPDGHVCSLFPGHAALHERERAAIGVHDAPKPPARRMTLTLPALAAARAIYLVAFGEDKAEAIRETLESTGSRLPSALAIHSGPRAVCMLDREAAGLLTRA